MPCERLKAAYELPKTETIELNLASSLVTTASCSRWSRPFSPFHGVIATILCLSQITSRKLRKLSEDWQQRRIVVVDKPPVTDTPLLQQRAKQIARLDGSIGPVSLVQRLIPGVVGWSKLSNVVLGL